MICNAQPSNGVLSNAFASIPSTGMGQRNGSSLLAQKFSLAIGQQPRSSEQSKSHLPVCQIKGSTVPALPKTDTVPAQVNEVARGIRTILSCPDGSILKAGASLESLYTLTERIVLSGNEAAERLYDRVKIELERGIGDVASSLCSGPSTQTVDASLAWLQRLSSAWLCWCDKTTLIESILTLLNQAYLLEQPGILSLSSLSSDLFLQSIILEENLQSYAVSSIITCVNGERSVLLV